MSGLLLEGINQIPLIFGVSYMWESPSINTELFISSVVVSH